ncbi:MAG: hypothetical protein EPO32_14740 [Anaerolineae bacterium]|nr:MAG: hypothetical protein EPO32_14740 [Anaerolineae bacterium]
MTARRPVYVAHPLNAPTAEERESNRARAARWVAWLADRYLLSPVADWVVLSGVWTEDRRETGLECDRALVALVGTVIAVGPRMSDGMRLEAGWARVAVDMTGMCSDAPGSLAWWEAGHAMGGEIDRGDRRTHGCRRIRACTMTKCTSLTSDLKRQCLSDALPGIDVCAYHKHVGKRVATGRVKVARRVHLCPDCGERMSVQRVTGKLHCWPCWRAWQRKLARVNQPERQKPQRHARRPIDCRTCGSIPSRVPVPPIRDASVPVTCPECSTEYAPEPTVHAVEFLRRVDVGWQYPSTKGLVR